MLQTPVDLYLDAQTDMWLGSFTLPPRDAGLFNTAAASEAAGRLRVAFGLASFFGAGLGFGAFDDPEALADALDFLKAGGLGAGMGDGSGTSSSDNWSTASKGAMATMASWAPVCLILENLSMAAFRKHIMLDICGNGIQPQAVVVTYVELTFKTAIGKIAQVFQHHHR